MAAAGDSSYIDYETFLDPAFSALNYANSLVLATNNASDIPIDISTPLSRVLFDIEEVDKNLHTLATQSALPLLTHTAEQYTAGQRIVEEVDRQVSDLQKGYTRLQTEVIERYEAAEEVRLTVERLLQTIRLGRSVSRCLVLGRQLEAQMARVSETSTANGNTSMTSKPSIGIMKEDYRTMPEAASTISEFRLLLKNSSAESQQMRDIHAIKNLQTSLITPVQTSLQTRALQIIREFSLSSLTGLSASGTTPLQTANGGRPSYAQTEETKHRTVCALQTLYILSPTAEVNALEAYLRTALTSSVASIARSLSGNLPSLERTLIEVSARCQSIIALERLLSTTAIPRISDDQENGDVQHPSKPIHQLSSVEPVPNGNSSSDSDSDSDSSVAQKRNRAQVDAETAAQGSSNFLQPLLVALDTSSLPSYFWRSLAEGLGTRMTDLVSKGGQPARTLRMHKDRLRVAFRECVVKGSQAVAGTDESLITSPSWEREAAVMVGSVVGPLGR